MPDAEICSGFSVLRSFKMMMLQPAHPAYAYLIRVSCWRQNRLKCKICFGGIRMKKQLNRSELLGSLPVKRAVLMQILPAIASQMVALAYGIADTYLSAC